MSNKLPTGWIISNIGKECDVLDSKRIPINSLERSTRKGKYPYYGANGIQGFIDDFIFEGEYILLAEDGGNFDQWESRPISYLVSGRFWVNNHAHILKAKNNNETRFFHFSLVHKNITKNINGGTRAKLNQADMRDIELLLPPLLEQQKIAAILTSVDEVIESTQAQINKLKDLKTGMMQELLTKGIGHAEFKDSSIGRIPVTWEVDTLAHCALIKNNLRKPINKDERSLIKGIYPYFGPTKAVDYINEYRIEGEHVLIGEDGDHFIKFSTWPMTQFVSGKFNVNNHAHIIQGVDTCRTKWIYYYFMHRDIAISLTHQGATRYKLNKASLEELELVLPSIQEQDHIIKIFDALMEKLVLCKQKILKLECVKKALMQDLLTGKVRVKITPH